MFSSSNRNQRHYSVIGLICTHTNTHPAVSILKDCCGFRRRAPSLVMREKTNIWSALILLIWGGAEAKHTSQRLFVKYAGVCVLEVQWRPGGEHHSAIGWAAEPCRSYALHSNPSSTLHYSYCMCADARSVAHAGIHYKHTREQPDAGWQCRKRKLN